MPSTVFSDVSYLIMTDWKNILGSKILPCRSSVLAVLLVPLPKWNRKNKHPKLRCTHNFQFTSQSFRTTFKFLRETTLEQRRKISGLGTDRADLILAGASVIQCLLEATGSKKIIISGCGIREGLFLDYYAKKKKHQLSPKTFSMKAHATFFCFIPQT